jgi:hypothetical protein
LEELRIVLEAISDARDPLEEITNEEAMAARKAAEDRFNEIADMLENLEAKKVREQKRNPAALPQLIEVLTCTPFALGDHSHMNVIQGNR